MSRGEGLRFAPASPLVARALEELSRGPVSSRRLARRVLGVRGGPPEVAEEALKELLAGDHRIRRDRGGTWRIARPTPAPDAELRRLDYAVVDVETTGTSPSRGARILEIAVVEVSAGEIVGEFGTLVNPGGAVPPFISRLTGITDEMVADAPPFAEVAELVRARLEERVFVAHNVPFDWCFLESEMRRARSLRPVGPRLCTLRLARRALPRVPRKGLDAVSDHYGVEIQARHRARGDALATAAVLDRLLGEAERLGITRWEQLQRWLSGGAPPGRA